jgi:hypothetical protein
MIVLGRNGITMSEHVFDYMAAANWNRKKLADRLKDTKMFKDGTTIYEKR